MKGARFLGQVFSIAEISARQARQRLEELLIEKGRCPKCIHAPFTAVILDFFASQGGDEQAAKQVQEALRDTALSASCSSQAVEKMHAHVQVSQNTLANAGRRPGTVQRESYILAARIAHSRLKAAVEKEIFGPHGVARARKLMGSRVVATTKASNSSLRSYAPTPETSSRGRSKFVRHHVLKIPQKKRAQKAANVWHAFLALHRGSKLRDDSKGMSQRYHEWLNSPVQRQVLVEKARTMAEERCALASNLLAADVQTTSLSEGQKRRLGHAQLDRSLNAVAQHPAWQKGLRIQDPNTALGACHILSEKEISAEECRKESDGFFRFDCNIAENPERFPAITRTCHETKGGLCCEDNGCAEALWSAITCNIVQESKTVQVKRRLS